jgi:parvulin-like peptidyl-prolyl isomerase
LTLVVLISSLAIAQSDPASQKPNSQTGAAAASQAQAPASKSADVAPDAAVITIDGFCAAKDPKTNSCKTVVTRTQFEQMIAAISGGRPMNAQKKRQLAMSYAQTLLYATQAEKDGLDKTPEAQDLLRLVRLQVEEEMLKRSMQKKAQPSPEDIQKYYNDNKEHYLELSFEKIVLPVRQSGDAGEDAEMKGYAEGLQKKAASGGDFAALQKEASEKAGQQNTPETKVTMSPAQVPQSHQAVLKLKPGEVSEVIQDGTGYYIYKLIKQDYTPLDQVKAQITGELTNQKMKQLQEQVSQGSTPTLNPDYFASGPPAGGMRPAPGGVPPAPQSTPPPKLNK